MPSFQKLFPSHSVDCGGLIKTGGIMVEIKCTGSLEIGLSEMTPMQGELKSLSDKNYLKLKTAIEEQGFSAPFFIWTSPDDGLHYIVDGHQRYATLHEMQDEGIELPDKWPAVAIEAKDFAEAKKKLLQISSTHGDFSQKGLLDFMGDDLTIKDLHATVSIPTVKIPEVEIKGVPVSDGGEPQEPPAGDGGGDPAGARAGADDDADDGADDPGETETVATRLAVACPECGHEFHVGGDDGEA